MHGQRSHVGRKIADPTEKAGDRVRGQFTVPKIEKAK
jgi:hypothetical protein